MNGSSSQVDSAEVGGRESEVFISIPVKRRRFLLILLGAWIVVWMAVEAVLVLSLAGSEETRRAAHAPSPFILIPLFAAFTAAGLFLAWRFLWLCAGRETLTITPLGLTLRREVGGLGHSRRFLLEKIRGLRVGAYDEDLFYPSWGRMFVGKGLYYIAFEHEGQTRRFGRGVNKAEALKLVERVRTLLP